MLKPKYYTITEGGKWLVLPEDFTWTTDDYEFFNRRSEFHVKIKELDLNAIWFETEEKILIWDCVAGFDSTSYNHIKIKQTRPTRRW